MKLLNQWKNLWNSYWNVTIIRIKTPTFDNFLLEIKNVWNCWKNEDIYEHCIEI